MSINSTSHLRRFAKGALLVSAAFPLSALIVADSANAEQAVEVNAAETAASVQAKIDAAKATPDRDITPYKKGRPAHRRAAFFFCLSSRALASLVSPAHRPTAIGKADLTDQATIRLQPIADALRVIMRVIAEFQKRPPITQRTTQQRKA